MGNGFAVAAQPPVNKNTKNKISENPGSSPNRSNTNNINVGKILKNDSFTIWKVQSPSSSTTSSSRSLSRFSSVRVHKKRSFSSKKEGQRPISPLLAFPNVSAPLEKRKIYTNKDESQLYIFPLINSMNSNSLTLTHDENSISKSLPLTPQNLTKRRTPSPYSDLRFFSEISKIENIPVNSKKNDDIINRRTIISPIENKTMELSSEMNISVIEVDDFFSRIKSSPLDNHLSPVNAEMSVNESIISSQRTDNGLVSSLQSMDISESNLHIHRHSRVIFSKKVEVLDHDGNVLNEDLVVHHSHRDSLARRFRIPPIRCKNEEESKVYSSDI